LKKWGLTEALTINKIVLNKLESIAAGCYRLELSGFHDIKFVAASPAWKTSGIIAPPS
jgi:hypothetical protein